MAHRATADLSLAGLQLGDSIAVNGACLTAVDFDAESFVADLSAETLSATTLGTALEVGSPVNLERSLTLADSLGGHLVSGHVDGVGQVCLVEPDARSTRMGIQMAPELMRYAARKGSMTVDGTSLTVNEISDSAFFVNIVPHTLERTIMGNIRRSARGSIWKWTWWRAIWSANDGNSVNPVGHLLKKNSGSVRSKTSSPIFGPARWWSSSTTRIARTKAT